jgi:hypothetical protein
MTPESKRGLNAGQRVLGQIANLRAIELLSSAAARSSARKILSLFQLFPGGSKHFNHLTGRLRSHGNSLSLPPLDVQTRTVVILLLRS